MKNIKYGEFCKVYGKTLRNKAIEHILELGALDFAVGDIAKEIGISRPKAYSIIREIEKEGIVKKTRIVSKSQLYSFNFQNPKSKLLRKAFEECLKKVIDEYNPSSKAHSSARNVCAVCAKHF